MEKEDDSVLEFDIVDYAKKLDAGIYKLKKIMLLHDIYKTFFTEKIILLPYSQVMKRTLTVVNKIHLASVSAHKVEKLSSEGKLTKI